MATEQVLDSSIGSRTKMISVIISYHMQWINLEDCYNHHFITVYK